MNDQPSETTPAPVTGSGRLLNITIRVEDSADPECSAQFTFEECEAGKILASPELVGLHGPVNVFLRTFTNPH